MSFSPLCYDGTTPLTRKYRCFVDEYVVDVTPEDIDVEVFIRRRFPSNDWQYLRCEAFDYAENDSVCRRLNVALDWGGSVAADVAGRIRYTADPMDPRAVY